MIPGFPVPTYDVEMFPHLVHSVPSWWSTGKDRACLSSVSSDSPTPGRHCWIFPSHEYSGGSGRWLGWLRVTQLCADTVWFQGCRQTDGRTSRPSVDLCRVCRCWGKVALLGSRGGDGAMSCLHHGPFHLLIAKAAYSLLF